MYCTSFSKDFDASGVVVTSVEEADCCSVALTSSERKDEETSSAANAEGLSPSPPQSYSPF